MFARYISLRMLIMAVRNNVMTDPMIPAIIRLYSSMAQAAKGTVDQWRGLNLLGCALMEVRDWLRES